MLMKLWESGKENFWFDKRLLLFLRFCSKICKSVSTRAKVRHQKCFLWSFLKCYLCFNPHKNNQIEFRFRNEGYFSIYQFRCYIFVINDNELTALFLLKGESLSNNLLVLGNVSAGSAAGGALVCGGSAVPGSALVPWLVPWRKEGARLLWRIRGCRKFSWVHNLEFLLCYINPTLFF